MASMPESPRSMPMLSIRDMTRHDVAEVIRIERESYPFPWSEGIFRDCLRSGYICCVVEIDDIIMGYAVMSTGAGEAHVLNICVAEPWRGRGIGGQLLGYLLEFADSLSVGEVFLEVRVSNTTAIRLYSSLGFSQIGVRRGYYQAVNGREDAIVLHKLLRRRRP